MKSLTVLAAVLTAYVLGCAAFNSYVGKPFDRECIKGKLSEESAGFLGSVQPELKVVTNDRVLDHGREICSTFVKVAKPILPACFKGKLSAL